MVYNNKRSKEDINYDLYQFSVAQKYDLNTKDLTYKKIKYIKDEIVLELHWRMRRTLQWQTSLFFITVLFFLRMFVHYSGQYLTLKILQVPIEQFTPLWYRINLEYAAFEYYQEAAVVVVGAMSNTFLFLFMYGLALFCKRWCKCFPKIFYRIICWMGIFAVLDPYIVFLLDICSGNDKGDMFKFYNWFNRSSDDDAKDSGLVGIYITILVHFIILVLTGWLFYQYMLRCFMNGRILDLYRRLAGNYKTFFIPLDNEVSAKYLQWVVTRAKKKDCVILSEMQMIQDKYGTERKVRFV